MGSMGAPVAERDYGAVGSMAHDSTSASPKRGLIPGGAFLVPRLPLYEIVKIHSLIAVGMYILKQYEKS